MTDSTTDQPARATDAGSNRETSPLSEAGPALSRLSADSKAEGDWPDLYAPLIGSWTIESTLVTADGTTRTLGGEWHFERVLGGMGVQDVLFATETEPHQYGTSLRVVDPRSGLWHVVWMQPGSGEFVALIGRVVDDSIVHEGHPLDEPEGPLQRWSFTDITSEAFTWVGEASMDGGLAWSIEQTMFGKRIDPESGRAMPRSGGEGI